MPNTKQDVLRAALERWRRSLLDQDAAAAAELRDEQYVVALPDGRSLTRAQELATFDTAGHRVMSVELAEVGDAGPDRATATFDLRIETAGEERAYSSVVDFACREGRWRATEAIVHDYQSSPSRPDEPFMARLRRRLAKFQTSFQTLAYLPYKPHEDYAFPPSVSADRGGELPIPPQSLWLGYNYPAHGKAQVQTMFDILRASGFTLRPGDRVLDFGCGAGRLIRHLRPFADTCEIWGADISAEHIFWCKRNLSPPFHFATTTKVPHLPFEDRSFRLVYCASVFTHIDDLADAWLLELRRILTPDGRLYVTIHDNRTVEIIEQGGTWLDGVRKRPVYRDHKDAFDMITIARDDRSQVFYDRDYFCRMAGQAFDVVSVTPEAYFYQTAVLLKRK